jgi:hypothetical protein
MEIDFKKIKLKKTKKKKRGERGEALHTKTMMLFLSYLEEETIFIELLWRKKTH